MIDLAHPEALLLGVVVLLALRRRLGPRPLVVALRLSLLLLLLLLLAGPSILKAERGRDLVLLLDRSRSMPAEGSTRARELAELAAAQAEPGDRIGLIGFGRHSALEAAPREGFRFQPPVKQIDADATDLARGLDGALALIPPARAGSILVISDGEATGADPSAAARAALRRGVRIDAVPIKRGQPLDIAVDELAPPAEVATGEPFQWSAWVRADRAQEVPYRLRRDGEVIASGTCALRPGATRLLFRDRLLDPGIHRYELELDAGDQDRVPENDRAQAVVRVAGRLRVLCVTPRGRADRLTRSLASAGIETVVREPRAAPLTLDGLDGYRAVVLEDTPAQDLPAGALAALEGWVRHLGGGLLMTGGKASFGPGGYYRSPVEDALPVTMELRQEQRRFGLAMAIALDRSGSMAMPVSGGQVKMDLANLGACAAVDLLSRLDHVAVIAVDSAPHVVVALTPVESKAPIQGRIRSIESEGGGIFTYTALAAAAEQLRSAPQASKHIVLFADAADAEEPGDYQVLVPDLVKAGVTVSVIGLGKDSDPDAAFLRDVARLGNGRCFFVDDPAELPRVFAQETIQVARSSLVEQPTTVAVRPEIVGLGLDGGIALPAVLGYSLAYARPEAEVALVTADEQKAPFLAYWHCGLGRSAAFLGEVDGQLSGDLGTWDQYAGFFATLLRWLGGQEAQDEVFAEMTRQGHEAKLSVEVDPGREALLGQIEATVLGPDGRARPLYLTRVDERRLEGRVPLHGEGTWRAAVRIGAERFLRVPPVTLPYSPEFERKADPRAGEKLLARLCAITEGRVDPPASELLAGSRQSLGRTPLAPWCAWLAVIVQLLEIAVRRLGLGLPRVPLPGVKAFGRVLRRRSTPAGAPAAPGPAALEEPPARPVPPPPSPASSGLDSMLERAKTRARQRRD